MTKQDLDFDRTHLWHPYTSLTKPLPVYPIVSASGVRLKLDNNEEIIDGMSSWWTAIHGYNVPELNKAATEQLAKMSHVMFGGITHEPAIRLGQLLVEFLPTGLDRIFLADSGSISIEVAMKVAIQYQHALGHKKRSKFMTFRGGYHGDTSAAMSVCDPEGGMHSLFRGFLPEHYFAPRPEHCYFEVPSQKEIDFLCNFFQENADNSAAFILEPIVQGAGGMRMYSPGYVQLVRELCNEHEVLLIADEIATGFGRTGKLFAVEHAEITPDIICVGKAITGGYLTLAAMACTQRVAEIVCNGDAGVLMHGPTFMGNPLACAVAVESLTMLRNSPWQKRVLTIEETLRTELEKLAGHPQVSEVRVLGAIGVIETKKMIDVAASQAFLIERGCWIRPFRNLLYIMPPYVISNEDLLTLTNSMAAVLEDPRNFK